MTTTAQLKWQEWTKPLPTGVGALPPGEVKLYRSRFFGRQRDTGKIFSCGFGASIGFGAGASDGPPDCGSGFTPYYDQEADEWSCVADPNKKSGGASGDGGGGSKTPIQEACPPGQVRNAQGQCVSGGGAGPTPTPTPSSSTSTSSGTNWTMWLLIGAGVLGAGIVAYAVMRKPKSKEIRAAAHSEAQEAKRHNQMARALRMAASRRAAQEARESRMLRAA